MAHLDVSWWGHHAVYRYDLPNTLAAMNTPVLLLNPEDDLWHITPRAAPFLKNGRMHDLPGWSFGFLNVEAPKSAALIRNFLDEPTHMAKGASAP